MKIRILPFFLLIVCLSFSQGIKKNRSFSIQKTNKALDEFISEGMEKWEPPGLAVTVVKEGEIVFTRAYGVTSVHSENPVNLNTLFGCMSTTKAFVAAGLAMLVDDGKLKWEDKVIDHLPEFRLKDPYITREMNIIDLLTHRTGLGNTDYLWAMMEISSDSVLYHMRDVEKSYSLRSGFIYQNIFYLAAGKIIERVTGLKWGEFLKKRLFDPLGMTQTYPTLSSVKDIENRAEPHFKTDGEISGVEPLSADAIGPAGSMWSTINDAGKWIRFLLNDGIKEGDTLISPKNFSMLFQPHQVIPSSEFYPTRNVTNPNFMTYGLGWFQHDYKGKMVQFHTGSLPGQIALAGMIPEEEIGVYIMGNLDHAELRHAIMYAVFDLYSDGELSRDWSEELFALYHPEKEESPESKQEKGTKPGFEINAFLGHYRGSHFSGSFVGNDLMRLDIFKEGDILRLRLNDKMSGVMEHWAYNTYKVVFDKVYYGSAFVNFILNSEGDVSHLEIYSDSYRKIKPAGSGN